MVTLVSKTPLATTKLGFYKTSDLFFLFYCDLMYNISNLSVRPLKQYI